MINSFKIALELPKVPEPYTSVEEWKKEDPEDFYHKYFSYLHHGIKVCVAGAKGLLFIACVFFTYTASLWKIDEPFWHAAMLGFFASIISFLYKRMGEKYEDLETSLHAEFENEFGTEYKPLKSQR